MFVKVPALVNFFLPLKTKSRVVRASKNSTALHKNIQLRPTRQGYLFACLLIAMSAVAINYNNSLFLTIVAFLLSLTIVSVFHAWRNLSTVNISFGQIQPTFAQQLAYLPCTVKQTSTQSPCLLNIMASGADLLSQSPQEVALQEGSSSLLLSVVAEERGLYHIDDVVVSCLYPMGMCKATLTINQAFNQVSTFIVYPMPFEGDMRTFNSGTINGNKIDSKTNNQSESNEFSNLREYRPGDPISRVHWKSAARGLGTFVKNFDNETVADEIWIDWHQVGNMRVEEKLSLMTRLVIDAEAKGDTYGVRLPNSEIPLDVGEVHKHNCLAALALFSC